MKKWVIICIFLLIATIGAITGIILFKDNDTQEYKVEMEKELANENIVNNLEILNTASVQELTSPNTILIFKTLYKQCNHEITQRNNIPDNLVNLNKEDISKEYKEWNIDDFSISEITFSREDDGICDEHYILKDKDGYIAIYTIDKYGKETLKELTQIITSYLPEEDLKQLQKGIKVIGNEKLNATIEDYE